MLNVAGIHQLADDLVMSPEIYDQNDEQFLSWCHTVACQAGLCLLRRPDLLELAVTASFMPSFAVRAGVEQLNIESKNYTYPIFADITLWPIDLASEYLDAGTDHRKRVLVALKALERLLPDGKIDLDPKAIHTPLTAWKEMLTEQVDSAAKAPQTDGELTQV